MLISFELSMPGANSWNGKWSGDGKCYAIVRSYRKPMFKLGYYSYSFGDGWRAAVTVRECSPAAARKLRKQSRGFCGYDWMVDRIVNYGKILNDAQLAELLKPASPESKPATPEAKRL
jgi:hypothetical protein